MIKHLEIWNFENHEHAVFDKFSPQFNLIFGDSNAGKTSVVRALKLIAFNEFNQGQVRIGSKFCEVECVTDKGKVHVKRGKNINEWIVTPNGQAPKPYESVGVQVLEDVEQILGLKIIKLGDIDIKANIMDQLESHFMMSEVDGKQATGSLRAQIVDEISGLSGIEQLIKEISLDNLRMSKEIKNLDEENGEIKTKLHDPVLLNQTDLAIQSAEKFLTQNQESIAAANKLQSDFLDYETTVRVCDSVEQELSLLLSDNELALVQQSTDDFQNNHDKLIVYSKYKADVKGILNKRKTLKDELDTLVPTEPVESHAISAQNALERLKMLAPLFDSYSALNTLVECQDAEFDALPDVNKAKDYLKELEEWNDKYNWMNGYLTAWLDYEEAIEDKTTALNKLPDTSGVDGVLDKLSKTLPKIQRLVQIKNELDGIIRNIETVDTSLNDMETQYHQLEKDNEDILNEFDVCPFCAQEIISKVGV